MAEYRYYLIPDFMSHVFPQQFEEQAPTEFFSDTADLMKRYQQLREMPYNNEYTWNERTNLPYPRLTVGIDRRDPDGAVTIMQVRNGVNYLCDDYRGPFADRNDKQLIEMAKQLVTAVGVDRIRPHYYTEENGHTKVHVGNDIHITEWGNAPELCSALRFSRFLNRDGQQLFQVRNGQRIIENYADGSQLVKDVQTVDDTHFYVGSRFCHIQQYAKQCFKRGCYVEPEHPQPGDKLDRLLIYQIPHYTCEYRFTDYDYAQSKLKATDYRCAYVANVPRDYTPDKCFRDFNYDDRPCTNSMPSLSVSDLIVLERGDKAEALYVDAVGFKDVSRLLPELHDMEVERQEHNLDELERCQDAETAGYISAGPAGGRAGHSIAAGVAELFVHCRPQLSHHLSESAFDSRPAARRRGLRQHGILEYEGKPAGHARQQKHHRAAAPTGRGGGKAGLCHRRYHTIEPDTHRRAVGGHGHNAPAASAR